MKSSDLEPEQKQPPLKEKPQQAPAAPEAWRPHPENPSLEISPEGKLRTKLPLPWLENL